ncbi:MAG: chorismate-binding protein [Pirellulales bacterium]
MDAMKACLPAGTVSGAPKVRAMEIIDEIEPHRRGPYAGAVGYIDYAGNMDTCIALRTIVFCNDKIHVQAGAGIVADSASASEYQETLNKQVPCSGPSTLPLPEPKLSWIRSALL